MEGNEEIPAAGDETVVPREEAAVPRDEAAPVPVAPIVMVSPGEPLVATVATTADATEIEAPGEALGPAAPLPTPAAPEPTEPGPPTAVDLAARAPEEPASLAPSLAPAAASPRRRSISPRNVAWLAIAGGALLMGIMLVPLATSRAPAPKPASGTEPVVFENARGATVTFVPDPDADAGAGATASAVDAPSAPHSTIWRVAALGSEANAEIVEATIGKRTIVAALAASGLAKPEVQRVLKAFEKVKRLDHCGPKDAFTIAIGKGERKGKVLGFELATSPVDVWQAKDRDGALLASKLDMHVDRKRIAVAVTIGDDLRSSVMRAGLDDDMVKMLGDALEGHVELASMKPGARLRIVATEDRVEGAFGRYAALDAVEYFPGRPNAASTRAYWYARGGLPANAKSSETAETRKKARGGYYDAKGRQPYHGGWRMPVPLARVSSRFNPNRMHPVLHVVMPHNGVDFGASTGTPIYATAAGSVRTVGDGGACGNMVQVQHANGLTSVYCHMSRFASGLHAGQHVEARQLVGYVGQTGRVTGPHLHFAVKRGETFMDPLSLRLDGMRVLPHADREEFARRREELNAALEAIAMPHAPDLHASADAGAEDGGEPEIFFEEGPEKPNEKTTAAH